MDVNELAERIYLNLPFEPGDQQVELIAALARFCLLPAEENRVMLLAGYAGTGKTSIVGALVRALREVGASTVLLAPTGRAAKVFGRLASHTASTIHRRIYRSPADGSMYGSEPAENNMHDAVFIVDEASMIGNEVVDSSTHPTTLLDDLIHYVYSGDNCRLILLGDTAQLPPVGCIESPAMSKDNLRSYGLKVSSVVLTDVVRQGAASGILANATWLRRALRADPLPEPRLVVGRFDDVEAVEGTDLEDLLSSSYSECGVDETLMITRSNKRAVEFNRAIRTRIFDYEEELCIGERLLVARNNYYWSAKVKGLDFVANGDVAMVNRIMGVEEKYGLRFADVSLTLPDRNVDFDCKIVLDALYSQSPSLTQEQYSMLYNAVLTDPDIHSANTPMSVRMKLLRHDPYFNALQVKYAYCVTCHKAQGGQWSHVYVDMGYIPAEAQGVDFYRWLYTATTRATKKVYFVNPTVKIID